MARMLGRSKSMRLLKGSQKEIHQRDGGPVTPQQSISQGDKPIKHAATIYRWVETPEPQDRPRTSGGADRSKLFHKKVAPATSIAGEQTANISVPTASPTVLYTAEVHEDGIIGIALGSPSMASPWNTPSPGTDFVTSGLGTVTHICSDNSSRTSTEGTQEASKPKLSRWRSIFGRKNQTQPQQHTSFYQLQQSTYPVRVDSHHEEERLAPQSISTSTSRAVSPAIFRPEIRESRNMTEIQPLSSGGRPRARTDVNVSIRRPRNGFVNPKPSPKPPPKESWSNSPTVPKVVVSDGSHDRTPGMFNGKSLLDVDIPRIEMERYSVMFGSLLQPNRSSLLERRQGNPDKLKPLTELSTKTEPDNTRNGISKPQRRATSPALSHSPAASLSLFPPPDKPHTSIDYRHPSPGVPPVHRLSPLQRSRTAPPSSPSRQLFANGLNSANLQEATRPHVPAVEEDAASKTNMAAHTPSSRHSFESNSEEVTVVMTKAASPWSPQRNEPDWEIVSKPPTRSVSQKPYSRADTKTRRQYGDSPTYVDTTLRKDGQATVGVARSVSVSRAGGVTITRRDMLKPLNPKAADVSEKLVDRKPLTPTLVELQNRRSHRAQMVET